MQIVLRERPLFFHSQIPVCYRGSYLCTRICLYLCLLICFMIINWRDLMWVDVFIANLQQWNRCQIFYREVGCMTYSILPSFTDSNADQYHHVSFLSTFTSDFMIRTFVASLTFQLHNFSLHVVSDFWQWVCHFCKEISCLVQQPRVSSVNVCMLQHWITSGNYTLFQIDSYTQFQIDSR